MLKTEMDSITKEDAILSQMRNLSDENSLESFEKFSINDLYKSLSSPEEGCPKVIQLLEDVVGGNRSHFSDSASQKKVSKGAEILLHR